MRARRSRRSLVALVGLLACLALTLAFVGALASQIHARDDAGGREASPQLVEARKTAGALSHAFKHVATTLEPSVVSIKSVRKLPRMSALQPIPPAFQFGDDLFDRFFRFQAPRQPHEQRGIGTGVVVREDGYILTNHHVIRDADSIEVILHDGTSLAAEVVGHDEQTDVAVLKVDAADLEPAKLGDSDSIDVGEWVVAVGNPFGLTQSVTAGIVSAKGRVNVGISDYEDFIQTDAAINPGNSGGPLANLDGQVVGINTAIVSRSGGSMGIGFAIPINMAQRVMENLLDDGLVQRGYLGVSIQDLTSELSESFGYQSTDGVLVGEVREDGPAAEAGMKSGDIVTHYDGRKTRTMHQLRNLVADTPPGAQVDIDIFRDGGTQTLRVAIAERSREVALGGGAGRVLSEDLGIAVENLTREHASRLGDDRVSGVVVHHVEPGGLAALAGVRVDDVIVSVGGQAITDAASFRRVVARSDLSAGLRLRVWSNGVYRFLSLKSR